MIEIKVCEDINVTEEYFKLNNIPFNNKSFLIRAMCKDKLLGYSLFEIDDKNITVLALSPEDDRLIADGILRSTLHVGTERGVTAAFYGNKVSEKLLTDINFLEDKETFKLKLQNLFSHCQNCSI